MQQAIPMQQAPQELPLRGLHMPAEPGFWPLAPGWWVVMVLLLLAMLWVAFLWYRKRQRTRQWLLIQSEIEALAERQKKEPNATALLTDASMLLRRYEKFHHHQDQVVSQTGRDWIDHLNACHSDNPFDPWAELLTEGIYRPEVQFDGEALLALVSHHIKQGVMKPRKETADV